MEDTELNYFVRVSNTDLDGTKQVQIALTGIKGVGTHTALVLARKAGVNTHELMGKLSDEDVDRIRAVVDEYVETVPTWMMNRPKDLYTGKPRHLLAADVSLAHDEDINIMRKMRCYRGIRHDTGQKVRGQRTKSTGRTGATVGVSKKKR
ncbi:MAG: 30S ribosomal protein S13 [Methanocalculus sp. MSAO_Arc1]|uniref:30S ribosomal protein S13 n=1 Tax=Methanocalculus TaxID=71151 RepID=UPI000FF5FECA|nr:MULTISPECIES: 30S ribosomal protein S13 [unclassified Methanocalculus]MCP1662238.1 small subunit ribosomal protein S13 [Methanocalculus sp. AMF5]RQD81692.1 MAG: 30S ribosomal protein S13 [Methanocalculus sp. MSAO_Arc1]